MAHFPPQNGYPSYRNQHQMLQQPQGNVLRQNIADRSVRDSFLSVTNCPTNNLNLQRDNSMKQLYDTCGTRYSENVYALPVQPNHQPPHTHRDFSDYQLAFSNVKESVVPK